MKRYRTPIEHLLSAYKAAGFRSNNPYGLHSLKIYIISNGGHEDIDSRWRIEWWRPIPFSPTLESDRVRVGDLPFDEVCAIACDRILEFTPPIRRAK